MLYVEWLLSTTELRPHQPKSEGLVSECGRIRDMASVSCITEYMWLHYTTLIVLESWEPCFHLSQRLSHACLSINASIVKLRMAHLNQLQFIWWFLAQIVLSLNSYLQSKVNCILNHYCLGSTQINLTLGYRWLHYSTLTPLCTLHMCPVIYYTLLVQRILDMLYEDTPELRRKPTPSVSFSNSNTSGVRTCVMCAYVRVWCVCACDVWCVWVVGGCAL